MPGLADATSRVFYRGKLVFVLPLAYATRYKLYVTGHVLLAAGAAFCLARRWRASPTAAGLCAVSYAYGGNVLFQYANVVFLVGAAWLPLAFLAADRMLVDRRLGRAVALGAVLALMVLGGDPQAAYNAGLFVVLYAWLVGRTRRRGARGQTTQAEPNGAAPARPRGFWGHRATLLATAAIAAAALSAVQISPSLQWTRRSHRAVYGAPRSVYEIPAALQRAAPVEAPRRIARGLFGVPTGGTHHAHIYHFRFGPWTLAGLLWPHCSGRRFPLHRARLVAATR